jgi:NADH-quinone oxidoreductase subunit J
MTSWLSPTGADLVLVAFGAVAVAAALLVVTTRQIVHAALWLVVSLGGVAGCFLVMGAEFVAWMQILIYLGAVVVIVIFGLMLTKAPIGRSDDLSGGNRWLAAAVSVAASAGLVVVLVDGFGNVLVDLSGRSPDGGAAVGSAVFGSWVLAFEALSVLLLSALVGAIAVSRSQSPDGR